MQRLRGRYSCTLLCVVLWQGRPVALCQRKLCEGSGQGPCYCYHGKGRYAWSVEAPVTRNKPSRSSHKVLQQSMSHIMSIEDVGIDGVLCFHRRCQAKQWGSGRRRWEPYPWYASGASVRSNSLLYRYLTWSSREQLAHLKVQHLAYRQHHLWLAHLAPWHDHQHLHVIKSERCEFSVSNTWHA